MNFPKTNKGDEQNDKKVGEKGHSEIWNMFVTNKTAIFFLHGSPQ